MNGFCCRRRLQQETIQLWSDHKLPEPTPGPQTDRCCADRHANVLTAKLECLATLSSTSSSSPSAASARTTDVQCGVVPYKSGWEPHAQQGSQIRRCDRSDENRKGMTGPTRSKGVPWPRTNVVFSATVAPTHAQPAEVRKDRAPLLPIRAPAMSEARNGLSAGKAKSAGREVSSPQPAPTPAAQRLPRRRTTF